MDSGELILAIMVAGFVGTPILAGYSLREWKATRPETFPAWRTTVGISAIYTILCGWFLIFVLTILRLINESWRYLLTEKMNFALIALALAAIACCAALKSFARALATIAGVLFALLALLVSLWLPGDLI
jgi:hypothetical protein